MSKRQCFYIPPDQHDENGWIPSLVTEGQPGHAPFTGNGPFASPWYWGKTLEEAQATAARENARLGISPDDALSILLSSTAADNIWDQPEVTTVRNAQIRVYDRAPGTDDASDMYVLEVLGASILVRMVTIEGYEDEPDRTELKIMIEAGDTFTVGVNEDENTYNGE